MAARVRQMHEDDGYNSNQEEYAQYKANREINEMPMVDRIIMDPINKYRKYNFFLGKCCFISFLVVIVTTQVILVIGTIGGYSRNDQNVFYKMFMDKGMELEDVDVQRVKYIYK